ncbi:hypothetical protein FHL15_005144 [Xylaria flabelliformis]|uniref:Major facilitator superfamily (MFS) profile domain-containing protein n=1 Tax=Xylaria flabelliformis TaxID=2512241 RepID=A0A553I1I0_9PEZI|nr:hypothetical protein FHL15_005144 [Xylaria flabelliformis]
MAPVDASLRKKVLKVIFVSLLLDLISFTFILPLFPNLLEFYRNSEAGPGSRTTVLARILDGLNAYKSSFSRPIDSRYDIVLLGGALGSLFSLLQAIASPVIGHLSDKYGRRTALLASMAGNILSVLLWVVAVDFRTFLASRIVGGLSEGNVQLATAIATDISDEQNRGSTMALIGACFSIAFTFGPALGAYLSSIGTVAANPFATAAAVSLSLIVTETLYLYLALPETLPLKTEKNDPKTATKSTLATRTNSHTLLNAVHFLFLLFFSGMEFSLPFMTYDLFQYTSANNGRLLGYIGLVASVLQGGVTRRLPPLLTVRMGVGACLLAFAILARANTVGSLYVAATCLATTSATVVSGLNTLASFEAGADERGGKLGILRSWGQLGRGLGPILFTSVYWWAGRELAYTMGSAGLVIVSALVFAGLKAPPGSSSRLRELRGPNLKRTAIEGLLGSIDSKMAAPRDRPYRHLGVFLPFSFLENDDGWSFDEDIEREGFIYMERLKKRIFVVQSIATGGIFVNKILLRYLKFGALPGTDDEDPNWILFVHYLPHEGPEPEEGFEENAFPELILGDFGHGAVTGDRGIKPGCWNRPGEIADWHDTYAIFYTVKELCTLICDGKAVMAYVNDTLYDGSPPYSDDLIKMLQNFEWPNIETNTKVTDSQLDPATELIVPNYSHFPTMRRVVDEFLPIIRDKVQKYRSPAGGIPNGWWKQLDVSWTKPEPFTPYEWMTQGLPNPNDTRSQGGVRMDDQDNDKGENNESNKENVAPNEDSNSESSSDTSESSEDSYEEEATDKVHRAHRCAKPNPVSVRKKLKSIVKLGKRYRRTRPPHKVVQLEYGQPIMTEIRRPPRRHAPAMPNPLPLSTQ